MRELRHRLRFELEALACEHLAGHVLGDELDRDGTAEHDVLAAIHAAHVAFPERRHDTVATTDDLPAAIAPGRVGK